MILERKWKNTILYAIFSFLFLQFGCSALKQPAEIESLFRKDAAQILSHLKGRNSNINSFQGVGRIVVNSGTGELNSNLFIAGKSPQKVRLEISHFWGKPLVHIVIDGKEISVLSLMEKKFFRCHNGFLDIDHVLLSKLHAEFMWDVLAGRLPVSDKAVKAVRSKENEILLLDSDGTILERILFNASHMVAKEIYFPLQQITVILSEFRGMNSGYTPLKIDIIEEGLDRAITIEYKDFEINKQIPDEVFYLAPLAGYEVIETGRDLKTQ